MICPVEGCGKPMLFTGRSASTLVAYQSPPGHNHDDNCLTKDYQCETGHVRFVNIRRRCPDPDCAWMGRESCFCHPGLKEFV